VFLPLSFLLPFCYLSFYLSFKMFRYANILEPPLVMLAASFISAVGSFLRKWSETRFLEPIVSKTSAIAGVFDAPTDTLKWKNLVSLTVSKVQRYAYRIALLPLAAVLILAMTHSTWDIQAQEENRYKAVAHHLSPIIKEDEIIFVWGYTNVMSWYMGEENEIVGGFNSSSFSENYLEADYIVIDPLMPSKWPDDPLVAYLENSQAAYTKDAVGGFELYTRRLGDW